MDQNLLRTVEWLRKNGFEPTETGNEEVEYDPEVVQEAYLCLICPANRLVMETSRLLLRLTECGVTVSALNADNEPCIQASYDPVDDLGIIDLWNVDDDVLFPGRFATN